MAPWSRSCAARTSSIKPILLLAHIDVVEAKREDWTRDPFKLVEENGWFYARGASDDKSMAAIFTDSLIRYKKEGYKPRRDIKLALTCGEETAGAGLFDSVRWLVQTQPEVLSAAFAINEGRRRRVRQERQAHGPADPGRREGLPGLRARSSRSRRPQLATEAAQRDRPPERGPREGWRIPFSGRAQPGDARLF